MDMSQDRDVLGFQPWTLKWFTWDLLSEKL